MENYDVVIIGAGPAGISASLYLVRSNKKTLVLYSSTAEVEKAIKIDNYYGFDGGISGKDLYQNGIKQAMSLGADVKKAEVLDIKMDGSGTYSVYTKDDTYSAKAIILATGNKRLKPNIKNIDLFEGRGVSYCAICDGFFYRKKKVGIIGAGDYAISEANELSNVTNNITIYTNGDKVSESTNYPVIDKKIISLEGEDKLSKIVFEDGSSDTIDGLFIALGSASGVDFAKKLGIITENDSIVVNDDMQTNIAGIYACGNVTGGLLQVSKAVYEGAKSALSVIKYLNK